MRPRFKLTAMDVEILRLYGQGQTLSEIGRTFNISLHSVQDHLDKIINGVAKIRKYNRGKAYVYMSYKKFGNMRKKI